MAKVIKYSMPRGDTRLLPVALPLGTYTVGASIFFALKTSIDAVVTDDSAVLKKALTDDDIVSVDAINVNYDLLFQPPDTTNITPGVYFAELEFVSADKSVVITYPDPDTAQWKFTITGEVNRRIT